MNPDDWNAIAEAYSRVQDRRRTTVFPLVRRLLREGRCTDLLDFGGGDGYFAKLCLDGGIKRVITYDPSERMTELARQTLRSTAGAKIVNSFREVDKDYDAITMNAVWMSLESEKDCVQVLTMIRSALAANGILLASVTHPCFRDAMFETFQTQFGKRAYIQDGSSFGVRVFDGVSEVILQDTHWSLSAMTRQLAEAGFVIAQLYETGDREESAVPAWLTVKARQLVR